MKTLLESKTFWVACTQALVGIITIFSTSYPGIGGLLVAKSIADIILRIVTTTSISAPGSQQ